MAKIILKRTNEEKEVLENHSIQKACEDLGITFQCKDGICGTCMIDIVKGERNLSELTENEKDLGRDKKHRLACQCKVKKGNVEIDF